jgi:hypothetical protein
VGNVAGVSVWVEIYFHQEASESSAGGSKLEQVT